MVFGEERGGLPGAEGFEAIGFDGAELEDGDVLLHGDLANPVVVAHVVFDVGAGWAGGLSGGPAGCAVRTLPDVADGGREKDGVDAFGFGIVNHLAEGPAEGLNGLDATRVGAGGTGDVLGIVADAFEIAAWFRAA